MGISCHDGNRPNASSMSRQPRRTYSLRHLTVPQGCSDAFSRFRARNGVGICGVPRWLRHVAEARVLRVRWLRYLGDLLHSASQVQVVWCHLIQPVSVSSRLVVAICPFVSSTVVILVATDLGTDQWRTVIRCTLEGLVAILVFSALVESLSSTKGLLLSVLSMTPPTPIPVAQV